jgi:hypothetical protein
MDRPTSLNLVVCLADEFPGIGVVQLVLDALRDALAEPGRAIRCRVSGRNLQVAFGRWIAPSVWYARTSRV